MKKLFVVALMAMSFAVTGCAADAVGGGADDQVTSSEAALTSDPGGEASFQQCCSTGDMVCPSNGSIVVDYWPPGCGGSHASAIRSCRAACGQPCTDLGWFPLCD
jgi:hypothetical protein